MAAPGLPPLRLPRCDDQGPRARLRTQPGEPVPLLRLEGGDGDLPRAPTPDGLGQHLGRPDDRPARRSSRSCSTCRCPSSRTTCSRCDWPTRSPGPPRTTARTPARSARARPCSPGCVAASAPGMSRAEATRVARDALSRHGRFRHRRARSRARGGGPRARGRGPARRARAHPRRAAAVRRDDASSRTDRLIDSGRGAVRFVAKQESATPGGVDHASRVPRRDGGWRSPCPPGRCWPTTCTSCR